jgi:hypothetical protein
MNLPFAVRTARWMVRDTFRQSVHTKLFWVMLAVTAVATAVCASVEVRGDMRSTASDVYEVPAYLPKAEAEKLGEAAKADGVRVATGEVSVGFGLVTFPVGKSREDAVRFVQLWLAGLLADTAGVLLALLWTAGFLPTFLEPQAATVLLAKPAPRWAVLGGKYVGVVLFVFLQAILFVGGTWAALGLRTGVWTAGYWTAVPLLVTNFAVFYAVSAFLAVWTRSTVACVFGTLLFWLLCWAVNFTHLRLGLHPIEAISPLSQTLLDVAYWVLPKPLDFGGIFFEAMGASGYSVPVPELQAARDKGLLRPELSVLSSATFAAATLGLAAYEFAATDY